MNALRFTASGSALLLRREKNTAADCASTDRNCRNVGIRQRSSEVNIIAVTNIGVRRATISIEILVKTHTDIQRIGF